MPPLPIRDRGKAKPPKLHGQPFRVATDPKMRADHTCHFEDCGKPLPRVAVQHHDPFCSTVCCRRYYEVAA